MVGLAAYAWLTSRRANRAKSAVWSTPSVTGSGAGTRSSALVMRSVMAAVRLRHLVTALATGLGEQGCEEARVADVDVDDLGAARGSGSQADGAAAETERIGHRSQRCLGRLAVHGLRAYTDDQGAVVLAADTGTRRARPHPDSDPYVTSIDGQSRSGRLRPGQAGVTRSTVPRSEPPKART